MSRAATFLLMLALAAPARAAQKQPTARAAEKPPTPAARAVAALEARLAAQLAQGTEFEHRAHYEELLADAAKLAQNQAADPAAARAYWIMARCHEALGNHPEKDAAFARYIDTLLARSKALAAKELRAEIESLVGRRELFAAIKVLGLMLAKFTDGPDAAYALYRLGTCNLWMDRIEPAIEALSEVVTRWPKSRIAAQARLRLARANVQQNKHAATITVLERFLAEQPDAPERSAALFDLAMARHLLGDHYGALLAFQRIVRDDPESPYVPLARAELARLRSHILQRIAR